MDSPTPTNPIPAAPGNEKKRQRFSSSPNSGNPTDTVTNTQMDPQCLPDLAVILRSIDMKLTALDTRISIVELIHKEFTALRQSLEHSQHQIETLSKENHTLKDSVTTLTSQLSTITTDYKNMKRTMLDLQSRSMRDNLVFTGIPEQPAEDTEKVIKEFITSQLKIPSDTVENITFHRVHRIGHNMDNSTNKRPRPIIAKFEHFKQKTQIQRQGKELKGTHYGLNDQFPKEIIQRRQKLFPIRKEMIKNGQKAVINIDKLYINGQLYRNIDTTPWLY